ncbi:AAA family ATPase [Terribacillus saccharophilus]|uniref:AAA family ATPase n=1 Tax=Terribacillus saccharophilus TaxID=361277 RepID=UPI000C9B29E9|nr:AAA family ATPase [Terribacillus goriensis]
MFIKTLRLYNFRQYFEKQEIHFSTNPKKNITVIHGENGAGKTALLNAFNWVLYGVTDLPNPNQLVSGSAIHSAEEGQRVEMFVELEFESRGVEYILKRSLVGTKNDKEIKNILEDQELKYYQNNNWKRMASPTLEINRILPENLRSYFFFDGERIDNLSKHEDNDEIKETVKNVMDLEVIDRSIKHTEDAMKEFKKEWADFADEETKQLLVEKDKLEEKKKELVEEQRQYQRNSKSREEQIRDIDEKLINVKSIREIQDHRNYLESTRKKQTGNLETVQTRLQNSVSKLAYLAPINILADKLKKRLTNNGITEEEAFPDLSVKLLNVILEQEQCICGEQIDEGKKKKIEELLKKESLFNKQSSKVNLRSDLRLAENVRINFLKELKLLEKEEYEIKEDLYDIENKLEEISGNLSKREFEDVAALESNRRLFKEDITEYTKKLGVVENELANIDQEISKVQNKIEMQQQIEDKAKLAKRRLETCEKIIRTMNQIYQLKETEVKSDLQNKIQEVYGHFLRKGFKVYLTDDFKLIVKNYYDEKVPLSQGERQITSLSFIGAIVDIARKHYNNKKEGVVNEGGIYPLVMDSPFGALDSDHRTRVARGIHKLSNQIIIIVSTSQWEGEVEREMRNFVGCEYNLNYSDPRDNKEKSFEYTEIQGW